MLKRILVVTLSLLAHASHANLNVGDVGAGNANETRIAQLASDFAVAMCRGLTGAMLDQCLRSHGVFKPKSVRLTPEEVRRILANLRDAKIRSTFLTDLKARYTESTSEEERRQITDLTVELNKMGGNSSPQASAAAVAR